MTAPPEYSTALGKVLTHPEVDRVVRGSGLFRKAGWTDTATSPLLTLSLSGLEFVDFGAAARLLLFLEGAARHGIKVHLHPPAANLRAGERRLLLGDTADLTATQMENQRRRIARAVVRRRRIRTFLGNTGFVRAARLPLLGGGLPRPLWEDDLSTLPDDLADLVGEETARDRANATVWFSEGTTAPPPAILPFEWLDPERAHTSRDWEAPYVRFLHDNDFIMSQRHAEEIVTTVLRELIENVRDHANADDQRESPSRCAALVGALTVSQADHASSRRTDGLYDVDVPLNTWLAGRSTPFVRIIVGDSGCGLQSTLERAYWRARERDGVRERRSHARASDIVLYSFRAGSSRHTGGGIRGTGLPAVRRFLRNYEGRVAVRTSDSKAGYWCPDAVTAPW